MKVEQANAIPLSSILEKIGFLPVKEKGSQAWYFSPFRGEKTPSFNINTNKNVWYDFGAAKGGSAIDFVCAWLESQNEDHTCTDALRWLRNMQPHINSCPAKKEYVQEQKAFTLLDVTELQDPALISYLNKRGISETLGKKYLKEIRLENTKTGKVVRLLGMRNDGGGFELRNKFFKGCHGTKDISFIRGKTMLPDEINVFEGFIDFLSALASQDKEQFEGDTIILHSVACLSRAFPYIGNNYGYKKVRTWLDNDVSGDNATKALQKFTANENQLIAKPMNKIYASYKDVNDWHMQGLKK